MTPDKAERARGLRAVAAFWWYMLRGMALFFGVPVLSLAVFSGTIGTVLAVAWVVVGISVVEYRRGKAAR